ncbi:MAG TPA: PIG-L family deacetylase, partial [Candidatus Sulfotelmatobacter sp.]|nr:PIG-L family deacetylase [Candidatus Sulfotelmatobacter sp.]
MNDGFAAFQQLLSRSRLRRHPALAIVVAHPDDEVIGAGAQLSRWAQAQVIHVTDGAPRNMADALAAGFRSREEYALARRKELESALALTGFLPARLHGLGCVDQEAAWHLAELVVALAEQLHAFQPEWVLTHPYEGGHPDHDATAFAVHGACQWLREQHGRAPAILEMTSYHNGAGRMIAGE